MARGVSISSKRKAIADSKRMMFIWVAGMSAIVGICVVVIIFLTQQIVFRAKVMSETNKTVATLETNNKTITDLKGNVLALETNQSLNDSRATEDEKALQVILDALPADRNTLALGSSLQMSLLNGVDGVSVGSIVVDDANSLSGSGLTEGSLPDSLGTIPIQLKLVATTADALKEQLLRLERSIRIIDIDNLVIEANGVGYDMTIQAHAYYLPAISVKLDSKVVPR